MTRAQVPHRDAGKLGEATLRRKGVARVLMQSSRKATRIPGLHWGAGRSQEKVHWWYQSICRIYLFLVCALDCFLRTESR